MAGVPLGLILGGLALKSPDITSDWMNAYRNQRDASRTEADLEQARFDLTQYADNPEYTPDYSKYSDPMQALKMGEAIKKQRTADQTREATGALGALGEQYRDIAGTPNLRFYADPESRAEMVKAGLQVPNAAKNPELRTGLAAFSEKAANQAALTDVYAQGQSGGKVNPDLMAYVSANKDLAGSFDNATQGGKRLFDQANYRDDKGIERTDKLAAQSDLAEFASAVQGLTSRAESPSEARRLKGTGGYDPQGEDDILAAFRSYPGAGREVLKDTLDNYRSTMQQTPVGGPYIETIQAGDATQKQRMQKYVSGGTKAIGGSVTNHPKQAPTGPTPKERERMRRQDRDKIDDLKLKRSLVKVEKGFEADSQQQIDAYNSEIARLETRYSSDYPEDAIAPPPKDPFQGDASRVIPLEKGKPKPKVLETKTLGGKTYYKVGTGPRDWVDKLP